MLAEAELDAAISRHFGPRRHTRDFGDDAPIERAKEPMPFEPIWYHRRASVALCSGAACRQGRDECPTPDACRLPADSSDADGLGIARGIATLICAWAVAVVLVALAWWLA